ncbi:MAG: ABC transporter permease [Lachnospiraceae bacterium]|nr:ABC transporter permease [Lachnospiraceae bacterium]
MFRNRRASAAMASPYVAWMAIFIVVPLLMVFYFGLTDRTGAFTLSNISAISAPAYLKSLTLAMRLSLISTVICFVLSYPLAVFLSRSASARGFIITIFILPMWMNFLLRTYAWLTLLEGNGIINSVLKFFGFPAQRIINTPSAIVFGMVYNFLPFMLLPLYNAVSRIDPSVIEAARDLGAGRFQTLVKVMLPLSANGIISGVTMVFIPGLTTFAISTLLGGDKVLLIGNVIESKFVGQVYDPHVGSGLSLVLMVFIIINMVISMISDAKTQEE